jgi:putative PIN family toxin of toxin-antitoxin system
MPRVVIDTNVIVSGLARRLGTPARVLALRHDPAVTLISSEELLAELGRVLRRPSTQYFTGYSSADVSEFVSEWRNVNEVVEPTVRIDASRDPTDNRVLEAALAGHADYIVSGDRDLLALGEFDGIPIVTPAQFLALVAET